MKNLKRSQKARHSQIIQKKSKESKASDKVESLYMEMHYNDAKPSIGNFTLATIKISF